MDSENSLLVDYAMTELNQDSGPYERGTRWAEPSVEHAATLMRFVYENRKQAEALGARGAMSVRTKLDPERTGAELLQRVQDLG